MTKKQKHYEGFIPFDIWGNQLHYPTAYGTYRADQVEDNCLVIRQISRWVNDEWTLGDYKSFFTIDKLKFNADGTINPLVHLKNYDFKDCLEFMNFSRGRSAAYGRFRGSDGREYSMFLKDIENNFKDFNNGKLIGNFTFCKRGANFGVKFLGE